MECRFLLNVVVREGTSVFKLLSCKDKSLLLWWDAFFVLDFRFDVGNSIVGLDVQSNSFTSKRLHKNLHCTTAKSENKMECGLLLDVVVRQRSTVFQLFSCEDKTLLLRRDPLFVLNLGFNIGDCVVGLDIKCNCFPR